MKAINEKRVQLSDVWNNVLSYESGELKRRVDPLRTVDLSPYLSVAPWVGGVCYLAVIFVQQVGGDIHCWKSIQAWADRGILDLRY